MGSRVPGAVTTWLVPGWCVVSDWFDGADNSGIRDGVDGFGVRDVADVSGAADIVSKMLKIASTSSVAVEVDAAGLP